MPISPMAVSLQMKKRCWVSPALRALQLSARLGIFKEKHLEPTARLLAVTGMRVITKRHPS